MQSAQPSDTLEAKIARFIVDLDIGSLTPEVRQGARWLMQDQLGVQIGCAGLPWSQQLLSFVRRVPSTRSGARRLPRH